MGCRISELQCKEVICVSDGRRLGFISDIEVEVPEGRVTALIVPGQCRCMGLLGRKDDFRIPWGCIKRIGPDIVLVEVDPVSCRVPRPNLHWKL